MRGEEDYLTLLVVVATLAVLMMLSVAVGSRDVSWNDIIAGLGGSNDNLRRSARAEVRSGLTSVLMPRRIG